MQVPLDSLLASLSQDKSLTAAIDRAAISAPPLELETPVAPYYSVRLVPSVIRLLWGKGKVRRPDTRLHIGVLGHALRLDRPRRYTEYQVIRYLDSIGIDSSKLRDCMIHANTFRVRAMLHSSRQRGRRHGH